MSLIDNRASNQDVPYSPKWLLAAIVLSTLPLFLNLMDVSIPALSQPAPITIGDHNNSGTPAYDVATLRSLSYTHSILEWLTFCIAVLVAILAFLHRNIDKNSVAFVIGLALLCSCCLDALHGFIIDDLGTGSEQLPNLIPFIWGLCRTFHALLLVVTAKLLCSRNRRDDDDIIRIVLFLTLVFGLFAYFIVQVMVARDYVPNLQFAENPIFGFIRRPFDLLPLFIFLYAGLIVYPRLARKRLGIFASAFALSAIPDITSHVHMAFGSGAVNDSHFNIAHMVRFLAYLFPLAGLISDYYLGFVAGTAALEKVNKTQQKLKKVNNELMTARDRALEASRHKSIFLANMSHELRTPLNSVIGFANILQKNKNKNLSEQDLDYIARIAENGKHLLSLINTILDLSKVESGQNSLEISTESLDVLIKEIAGQFESHIRDRDIELAVNLPENMQSIRTDRFKLKQVVINLVANAVRFTENGKITLSVITNPESRRPIRINVTDTGIGIPDDRKIIIFDAFQQADNSSTRQHGGTGLGLTISQSLCKSMGYVIELESEAGKGSTFSINLDVR